VASQSEQRKHPSVEVILGRQNRKERLLSGFIRCSCCGSGYMTSGKDDYRYAGQEKRGTCSNTLSVCKGSL
jgi:site-specific DNA recombinase